MPGGSAPAPRNCPKCGHKFSGATHTGRAGKGCDIVVNGKRCGCKVSPPRAARPSG